MAVMAVNINQRGCIPILTGNFGRKQETGLITHSSISRSQLSLTRGQKGGLGTLLALSPRQLWRAQSSSSTL